MGWTRIEGSGVSGKNLPPSGQGLKMFLEYDSIFIFAWESWQKTTLRFPVRTHLFFGPWFRLFCFPG
jgi:hypothetical protein